eukprot:CAMPEP_0202978982 /NCGR_PEP_ID=MMETSP1396-20130829/85257_1 /ASSEMBLY_ACC=CAM_ASM_000872 /TAXON_ID= /ORGANISM="Pseudokeronopsis sp., Strain Brazil" /LENGTH=55 /DNA_ID=CAMNT_0049718201 /DNA_START=916 /DNA_END=1083 /DNA_ORIENTATION=-
MTLAKNLKALDLAKEAKWVVFNSMISSDCILREKLLKMNNYEAIEILKEGLWMQD